MAQRFPIILCGKTAVIASAVIAGLKPEYEVIHVILTPAAGVREIPSLLQNGVPPPASVDEPDSVNLGSQDYTVRPAAVVTGAGYDDESFSTMRKACEGKTNIPWLRPDLTKPAPPLGPAYGEAMVKRVKESLRGLQEEGKTQVDGVHYY